MRIRCQVQETYQCDACGAIAETEGWAPDDWGAYYASVMVQGAGGRASGAHVPAVHVCPRCLEWGPGLLGRRVQEFLTRDEGTPEDSEANHGS